MGIKSFNIESFYIRMVKVHGFRRLHHFGLYWNRSSYHFIKFYTL